jgi:iron complex outermembrane recepter protein
VVNDPDSATDRLFNSYSKSREVGAGASYTAGDTLIGVSHQRQTSDYGVPGEEAFLDMRQSRTDLLARIKLGDLFESVNVRLAHTAYEHSEIELPDRVTAVTFKNKSTEGRLELNHAPIGPFKGSLVLQSQRRDFSALTPDGRVELVEPTKTTANALALVEQADFDAFAIDAGFRTENEKHQPAGLTANPARKFSLTSASIGGLWRFMPGFNAALTLSSNQRAPTPSELYTSGPHDATATFEVGSASLAKEKSRAVDLTLRKTDGPVRGSVALFTQGFSNYVYGQFADANGDGVADRVGGDGVFAPDGPFVFLQYTQRKARFHGGEFEIDGDLPVKGLTARLFGDRVKASLDDGTPLPRIAPSRLGTGLNYTAGPWRGGFTATRVSAQNRVSPLETPTAGYTRLDLNAAYRFKVDRTTIDLYALVRNATDEKIRQHTSFLKDSAPQPGRTVLVGMRAGF